MLAMYFYQWGDRLSTPGERLREAREKLGLTQAEFGAIGGVKKLSQLKYEKNEQVPGLGYLTAIAKRGVDVIYVITGSPAKFEARIAQVAKAKTIMGNLGIGDEQSGAFLSVLYDQLSPPDVAKLTDEEAELLDRWRRCSPEDQGAIARMAAALAVTKKGKK